MLFCRVSTSHIPLDSSEQAINLTKFPSRFEKAQSAAHAIDSFHRYVMEDGVTLTVQYARPKGANPTYKRGTFSQDLQFKGNSSPSHQNVDSSHRISGRFSTSFSPRDSTPSSINSNPPHALPPKPQSQSLAGFDSQINFVERLIQTTNGNGLPARFNEATSSVHELKTDSWGPNAYGPQNKQTNSGRKKKNYRLER